MLTIAADAPPHPTDEAVATHLQVKVFSGLGPAEAAWRALEADAVATPYQRLDWVRAYAASATTGADIRVIAAEDAAGRIAALWPLAVSRRLGTGIASGVGGKHANLNLPLLRPGLALRPDEAEALLRGIGRALDIDLIAVTDMPEAWDGAPNPFARFGRPGPNVAPEVRLDPEPEATASRSMSNEARKRLRNKERGLAKFGPVGFAQGSTEAEIDDLLDAFFRQKEARFRQLGIPDPFLDEGVRAFIRCGALAGLDDGRPAIELYGLTIGDEIAAVLGGAADPRRLSGMFISFEASPDVMKYSPGDILVSRTIAAQCRKGRRAFDLGTGDARYKRTFCDEEIRLIELLYPVTEKGRLLAAASTLAVAGKRRFKRSPLAMKALALLRRAKPGATLP